MSEDDKLTDIYWHEINSMTDNEYVKDTKKIAQNVKVWRALLDILNDIPDLQDLAEQLDKANESFSNACEIRAFKMGVAVGQAVSSVKA